MSKLDSKRNECESDDDDDDDVDYVPEGANESPSNDEDDQYEKGEDHTGKGDKKAQKRKLSKKPKNRDESDSDSGDELSDVDTKTLEVKKNSSDDVPLDFDKKKADDLWSSFLKDVKPASKVTNSVGIANKYESVEIKKSVTIVNCAIELNLLGLILKIMYF